MNIALTINGVLRNPETHGVIPVGNTLYQALVAQHSVYLLSDDLDIDRTQRWLTIHNLTRHTRIIQPRTHAEWRTDTQLRLDAVGSVTSTGTKVDLVIEPDPAISAELLALGYPVATLTLPYFAKPEWRPDYNQTPRPWDALVDEVEAQAEAYAADPRRTADPL
ncbi:hypothetical protein GCM10010331_45620 [Streptomyces xanthochromogenes]|uniref:hypothetical protein n=1 Tax=Streptomyces xanthochromogenes TaxID=67384 RepID=UPI001679F4D0|nr:hypothetical protein [Streptomyces xanthochromogenes]GHB52851.1 hypothetical protein GCM10010331_45620 [Streptomyces xanthochromogenes]